MEVARGGSFGSASKPSAKTSEKKNEARSRISQISGMVKTLYKNDFARLADSCFTFEYIYGFCRGLIRDTSLFIVAIIGFRLLAGELKEEAITMSAT